ncbi:MAG: hypothetical protein PHE55_03905, partial [Methylococcaceae bacterium]|nr:hypothetical protein [Methylococcaceae bacterium]
MSKNKPFGSTLAILYYLFITILSSISQTTHAANPIDTLPPGHWYEIPHSKIRSVLSPLSLSNGIFGANGPVSIVTTWNGGAYDSKRDRYIVWGGGHADYAGNEVYVFDLSTLQWIRLNDPSPASALTVDQPYYADGKPSARHTYDYTLYVPNIDRFCSIGGAALRGTGNGSAPNVDCFNFDTLQWERKADTYYWGIGARAAYHPGNGRVYALGSGGCGPIWCTSQMGEWDPVANVWQAPNKDLFYGSDGDLAYTYGLSVAIDPIRQKLYAIGQGLMLSYDLTVAHGKKAVITPLGASEIIGAYSPGLAYDPVSKNLVAWSGGQIVYTYDPDTNTWTQVSPASTNTVIPTAAAVNGTHNRFQYIPSKNAFIVVNSIDENVYVFKLPASSLKPVVSLTLSSPMTQTAAPFTLGQAFRQGDIPSGMTVSATIPNFQAVIKTRWPDGSAQFAILSGRANLQANVPLKIDLSAGPATPSTPALTEQDLHNFGANAQIAFQGIGSVLLSDLIGQSGAYDPAAHRWHAGKVQDWLQGPEMSSWIYAAPLGTDPSLSAWYEVRLWKDGQIEIIPWIENGYLLKPGATQKDGLVGVTVNGVSRFSATLSLPHHTRTLLASGNRLSYWMGADPQVTFRHDTDYLQQTKLVPHYAAKTAPASPLFTRLPSTFTPLAQGAFPNASGQTGYHPSIGLLPEWDVAYLSTGGDPRALSAIAIQAYLAGRHGIHYRDEKTNRPPAFSSHPNLVLNDTGYNSGISSVGVSSTNQYTASTSGAVPAKWATSHAPSVGYMAYLLYGQFYFMEETEFAATVVYLKQTDTVRELSKGIMETATGANTTRGAAWALRTLLHASLATPDDDGLKKEYRNTLDENFAHYHSRYVASPNNPQGVAQPYSDYTAGDGVYMHATWMEDFLTAAFGYILDTQAITPAVQAKARQFFRWKAQSVIGRLGTGGAGEYDFRDAAQYYEAVAPSDTANWVSGTGPWYADWGGNYQASLGAQAGTALPNQLRGAYFPDATGYWGNLQPAIAYAVIHQVPGAQAAYARMTGASNWNQFLANENNDPVWSVVPSASPTLPPTTNPPAVNPPTLAFTATPLLQGASTLTWSATGANACTASGGWSGAQPVSGRLNLTGLNTRQTYTLTCTGSGGTVSQTVTVTAP